MIYIYDNKIGNKFSKSTSSNELADFLNECICLQKLLLCSVLCAIGVSLSGVFLAALKGALGNKKGLSLTLDFSDNDLVTSASLALCLMSQPQIARQGQCMEEPSTIKFGAYSSLDTVFPLQGLLPFQPADDRALQLV